MENLIHTVLEKNKKIAFFDVFDTIILRHVEPEYVKKIWAKRVSIYFGDSIDYEELYRLRNNMEAEMCKDNANSGFDMEFNYSNLLSSMYVVLINKGLLNNDIDKDTFISICEKIEIETEMAVQYIDPKWLEVVVQLLKHNIKIYCVSDFYLSQKLIAELFAKHGILQYINEIYVSSEYLLTKKSGKLFTKIVDDNNFNPSDIIMVGDNEHSDYKVPLSQGIDAYYIDRKQQHAFYSEFRKRVESETHYANELTAMARDMSHVGRFLEISCSLFFYIVMLHKSLMKNGVKNVFFLSREGEFLLKLFDLYQEKEGYKDTFYVKPHYLKVSRKSTFLPSLLPLDSEKFEILFRQYIHISLYDFLSSLSFEEKVIEEISHKLNIDAKLKIENFPSSKIFTDLRNDSTFIEKYEESRLQQRDNFYSYIENFTVNIKKQGFHLVDVGWKGTIQDNIYRIYNENVSVHGYYLGLIASGDIRENNKKQGLLFSSIPYRTPYFNVYNENRALYEIVLGASHGSANKYIRDDYNHRIEVETVQTDMEKKLFDEVISPLQSQIYDFFERLCNLFCNRSVKLEYYTEQIAKIHSRMVLFPTKAEINFFNGLYHYENFGVFEYSTFSTKNKFDLIKKFKNTFILTRNPRAILEKGFWGPITLSSHGLGYLVPIYGRYKYNKSFKGGNNHHQIGMVVSANDRQLVEELKRSLDEKDRTILDLTQMIDDRDEAMKKMTQMIDDRDDAIKSMTQMIDERDEVIEKLSKSKHD
ncbi:HAD hydrolase-like protein [Paenibacillus ottowii]|uniref:HAD hydrolase-like protein n=1 Tax=Paenibacillus ottowii TaxID=2315729 RepID=UPI003D2F0142